MIVFDLACVDGGHVFEAWFGSTDDYASQKARGLVSCPICGSGQIDKAPMTPRLGTRGNKSVDAPKPQTALSNQSPAAIKAVLRSLAEQQARMLEKSDYVGDRFVDEARAIHLGDSEQRSIHGVASIDDARALDAEGISVAPLPFPVRPPSAEN
jgi:hypothetical protein